MKVLRTINGIKVTQTELELRKNKSHWYAQMWWWVNVGNKCSIKKMYRIKEKKPYKIQTQ